MELTPTLIHAETHPEYQPRPQNPRIQQALGLSREIHRMKQDDNSSGPKIYDRLVDSLIKNITHMAKDYEHLAEPTNWSAAQRAVWRFSTIEPERRFEIANNGALSQNAKSFVCVNAGRWIANCPFPDCHGSQYASFFDRRFLCVDCDNKAINNQWIEAVWPNNPIDVEHWLSNRPIDVRHWTPGETMTDIANQDAYALGHTPIPSARNVTDLSKWDKTLKLDDGTIVPVLHYGTPEWGESQKANN